MLTTVIIRATPINKNQGHVFFRPEDVSNLRFWNAINGEAWFINATEYGHADVYIEILSEDLNDVTLQGYYNSWSKNS